MIIYWCKNKSKKSLQVKLIENYSKNIQNLSPTNYTSNSNLDLSSEIEEYIPDNKSENYSFLSNDSDLMNHININNNDYCFHYQSSFLNSENNINSNSNLNLNEYYLKFNSQNFSNLNIEIQKQIIINLFEKKKENLFENIVSLINLCKDNHIIFNIIYEKIKFYVIDIMKSKENLEILRKLLEIISVDDKINLIYSIVKKSNELLLDKRGYKILLFLISFQKINIINIILYFILQNFIMYCGNPFSSEVIKALYALGEKFISSQLNLQLFQNLNEISKLSYGMNIIIEAKKYINHEIL
jgi:hypothetical protein